MDDPITEKQDENSVFAEMAFVAMLNHDPKTAKAHLMKLTDDQLQNVHYACAMTQALANTVWHLRRR
jgi:hypothetical protein